MATRKLWQGFTVRTLLDHVFQCLLAGCTADEIVAAVEKEGYAMDVPLAKDAKQPIHILAQRIVTACESSPEATAYYATLLAACKHVCDVAEGRVKKKG